MWCGVTGGGNTVEMQALQTGHLESPRPLHRLSPLPRMPFPPDTCRTPHPFMGLAGTPASQTACLSLSLVPLLSNCLSTLTASPLVPGSLGSEWVTFSKETELTHRSWVVPKTEGGEGQSAGHVQGVAGSFVADDRLHYPLEIKFSLENTGLVVWACPLCYLRDGGRRVASCKPLWFTE